MRSALALFLLCLPLGPARADRSEEAAALYQRGLQAYRAESFAQAAVAFQQAYELDSQTEYLFGWAQALRRGGDCPRALELYRKMLTLPLAPDDEAATRQAMARCQAMPAAPPPAAAPAPAPPAIAPPDAAPRDDGGPSWTGDWVGHAFVGAGALALAAGAGFTLASVADERDARSSEFYDDHDQLTGRATTRRIIGVSALGAGAALVTFGVFHYLSYAADGPAPALGAWLDRGGAGAVWTVPF